MDVIDIQRKAKDDKDRVMLIFNPLNEDFEWLYNGRPQKKLISKEYTELPIHLAMNAGNKLVDAYKNKMDKNFSREKAEKLVFSND